MTLVGFYDPDQSDPMPSFIYPALYGNWGNAFSPESLLKHFPDLKATACWLQVTDANGRSTVSSSFKASQKGFMNQFHINLPSSVSYVHAAILYKESGGERELDSRQLMPPHGKLPPPVVVGREHEFVSAALRLRDMDSVLTRNGYPSELQLHRAMEDYYGLIEDYAAGVSLKVGHVYRHKGTYARLTSGSGNLTPMARPRQDSRLSQYQASCSWRLEY